MRFMSQDTHTLCPDLIRYYRNMSSEKMYLSLLCIIIILCDKMVIILLHYVHLCTLVPFIKPLVNNLFCICVIFSHLYFIKIKILQNLVSPMVTYGHLYYVKMITIQQNMYVLIIPIGKVEL